MDLFKKTVLKRSVPYQKAMDRQDLWAEACKSVQKEEIASVASRISTISVNLFLRQGSRSNIKCMEQSRYQTTEPCQISFVWLQFFLKN